MEAMAEEAGGSFPSNNADVNSSVDDIWVKGVDLKLELLAHTSEEPDFFQFLRPSTMIPALRLAFWHLSGGDFMCDNNVVQGMWIGDELSTLEQLSITSFLRKGHAYYLYVYKEPAHVPEGTTLVAAEHVLPLSRMFFYRRSESFAAFSDSFRIKLLLEIGGWWADTDMVCLRPLNFSEPYVIASEASESGGQLVTNGIIKSPAGSELMSTAWEACEDATIRRMDWGHLGPRLLQRLVVEKCLHQYVDVEQPHTFCPVPYFSFQRLLSAEQPITPEPHTYTVHLWNEMWRRRGLDKNARYDPGCLYEQLKQSILG